MGAYVPVPTPGFPSVRLPVACGESVQKLVSTLVEHFLAKAERKGPDLATVLGALRARAAPTA
jgi:hypothetical protein